MENDTALLVMDMEAGILQNLPTAAEVIDRVAQALAGARKKALPVIYVVVGFRPGTPEISSDNKNFAAMQQRLQAADTKAFMQIAPALAPADKDLVVTKRRYSAFTGSDLEVVLRAQGIRHLVLTGVSTSGVVLSTLREAADKDYRLTVLSDGCGDADEEVHRVLTTKVFPKQAEILTVDEWSNTNVQ